jgi:hypothetical protein
MSQKTDFLIELKSLFDLFTIEVCENFLTDMKEFELKYEREQFTDLSRVNFEHYLDLRKGI